jgi:hypothetical protein
MLVRHTFPLDAEYEFSVSGGFFGLGGPGGAGGAIDVTLDGAAIPVTNTRNFRIKVTAGPHTIGTALGHQGSRILIAVDKIAPAVKALETA